MTRNDGNAANETFSASCQGVFMPQILVRDLSEETINRLKEMAKGHGRSLQSEIKLILEDISMKTMEDARILAERIRSGFKKKTFPDSAELIRQDRNR
jgi:antitoxin FitA